MSVDPSAITWQMSNIGFAGNSTWSSLAFGPAGQVSVAYYSSDEHAIKFAALKTDGTWDVSTVENVEPADAAPSHRYRFTQAAITYCVGFRELRYALNTGGGSAPPWSISTVALNGGYGNSLAIGPSRHPWVSFALRDNAGVSYAKSETMGANWVGSKIDDKRGISFVSLAFDPGGQAAVAYDTIDGIKYATFDGSHWKTETVGEGDGWCTLVFTPGGDPAIAFGKTPPTVFFALRSGGIWRVQMVAAGSGPSMALTHDGEPAISYYDGSAMVLSVLIGGGWNTAIMELAGRDSAGRITGPYTLSSLAFNPATGAPACSYYDRATGNIKCAVGTLSGRVIPPIVRDNIVR
jgi:hypothetical protein